MLQTQRRTLRLLGLTSPRQAPSRNPAGTFPTVLLVRYFAGRDHSEAVKGSARRGACVQKLCRLLIEVRVLELQPNVQHGILGVRELDDPLVEQVEILLRGL